MLSCVGSITVQGPSQFFIALPDFEFVSVFRVFQIELNFKLFNQKMFQLAMSQWIHVHGKIMLENNF